MPNKKAPFKKRLRWLAEYLPLLPLIYIIRALPHEAALRIGGFLGVLAFKIDKRHRLITLDNLKDCLPELGPDERLEVATGVYRNLGYSVIEFMRTRWIFERRIEDIFRLEDVHKLDAAMKKGKGVLLLTGHCGSWESMAHLLPKSGRPMHVVARAFDNPYLEAAVTRMRTMYGNTVINKQKGMRKILKALSEDGAVAILLDQNVTLNEGVFVDFFGRPACTNKGLALIAMKTGAPVVPAFSYRTGKGRINVQVWDEIPTIDTGDKEADIVANTQAYTKAIETYIRRYPDQWFWMHRRWKTRPPKDSDA